MPSFFSHSHSSESEIVQDLWDERGNLRIDVLRRVGRFAPQGFEEDFVADMFAMITDLARSGISRTQIAKEFLIQVQAESEPWDSQSPLSAQPPDGEDSSPGAQPTDERLLADYGAGDKNAFAPLLSRYQSELYKFLVRFLGNRASAEDVFQETFLQVHQSAEQFDPQRRFRLWLFTIAANKARDLIRSQARRPTNPFQASIGPGEDESGEFINLMESTNNLPSDSSMEGLRELVHNMVTAMPTHLREILLLSYFHQFPYKQASTILDIPLGTVKSRLHAAVEHLAGQWHQIGGERKVIRNVALSEADRRAVDLVLDRHGSTDYASADMSVGQIVSRVVAMLHLLDYLPAAETPAGLAERTLGAVQLFGQGSPRLGASPSPTLGPYLRETPFN